MYLCMFVFVCVRGFCLHYSDLCPSRFFFQAMLSVHNKEELVTPLLETAGSRLSGLLIETTESEILSTVISSMPTHITSWLQNRVNNASP